MVCYIYKERVLNIGERAYIDLSINSKDTESVVLGGCQFFANAITKPSLFDLIITYERNYIAMS